MFCAGHQASRPGHLVLPVTLLHGFQESIFKDKVRLGYPRICNELVYNSLIDGEVTGGVTGVSFTNPEAPVSLGATRSWSSRGPFLPFGEGFSICKSTWEMCISTVIQVLQRGATAEDMGEGSVPGRSHGVLLGYPPTMAMA